MAGFFFNDTSTFTGYLIFKPSYLKNSRGTNRLLASWNKGTKTFPKAISPKVHLLARLEFELAYYSVAVQHVSNYATGDSLYLNWRRRILKVDEKDNFFYHQW